MNRVLKLMLGFFSLSLIASIGGDNEEVVLSGARQLLALVSSFSMIATAYLLAIGAEGRSELWKQLFRSSRSRGGRKLVVTIRLPQKR